MTEAISVGHRRRNMATSASCAAEPPPVATTRSILQCDKQTGASGMTPDPLYCRHSQPSPGQCRGKFGGVSECPSRGRCGGDYGELSSSTPSLPSPPFLEVLLSLDILYNIELVFEPMLICRIPFARPCGLNLHPPDLERLCSDAKSPESIKRASGRNS